MNKDTRKYFFSSAIESLKRNITLTIASIMTISCVLLIIGVFFIYLILASENFEQAVINNNEIIMFLKYIKLIVLFTLPPISLFLIINSCKLAIFPRRNEISVMKFVGATNGFIRWPFIIQGIIVGIISAFVSNLFLYLIYSFVCHKVIEFEVNLSLIEPVLVSRRIFFPFLIIGIFLGTIGNIIALRKFMREEVFERYSN